MTFGERRRGATGAARRVEGNIESRATASAGQRGAVANLAGKTSSQLATPAPRTKLSPTLMQRAVSLLARREYSRVELRRKLQRRLTSDSEPEAVERVLDQLCAKDMLSESRFVQSRLRARAGRYGVARIRQELQQHQLEPEVVREALKPLAESEFERAWLIWERKFGSAPIDETQRAKQMRFLAARGFDSDTVIRIIRRARGANR